MAHQISGARDKMTGDHFVWAKHIAQWSLDSPKTRHSKVMVRFKSFPHNQTLKKAGTVFSENGLHRFGNHSYESLISDIESSLLHDLESVWKTGILPSNNISLSTYTALQFLRTPNARDNVTSVTESLLTVVARYYEIEKGYQSGMFTPKLNTDGKARSLMISLSNIKILIKKLSRMNHTIVESDNGYYLGSSPVEWIVKYDTYLFPLTPSILLIIHPCDTMVDHSVVTVDRVNVHQWENSDHMTVIPQ